MQREGAVARSSDLVQATMFKALGDGFVFQVPRAWPFGSVRHYLVTEAQKAAIVERLMGYGTRSLLLALLIWVSLLGGIAVSIALLTGHDDPTLADVAVLV